MVKPNITSWRTISISNAFNVSLKMNDSGNRYGFTSNVDTHMIKNSEWAAVSYLSQSKYGKIGNNDYSGVNKEIYQNKSNSFITGCSWGNPSRGTSADYGCQYTYDVEVNGTGASTTGTIYGIYDMSGGAWEYVMANYNDLVGNSGFTSMPESKYYDKYTSDNILIACNGKECLSHSLSEANEWYSDYHNMINDIRSWLICGGRYANDIGAGVFAYNNPTGDPKLYTSFRLVIT